MGRRWRGGCEAPAPAVEEELRSTSEPEESEELRSTSEPEESEELRSTSEAEESEELRSIHSRASPSETAFARLLPCGPPPQTHGTCKKFPVLAINARPSSILTA
jgi:hypothetical protein